MQGEIETSSFVKEESEPLRQPQENTLDLSAVAVARQRSHLPVIVDPSHAAGLLGIGARVKPGCLRDGLSLAS